ncbi:MAG: twin-arginine translocation signal domain-containing protein, partial [Coriobacteriia bacterium]|nr:twin-arginine translocation signal domain-containing protein [Coriobacteriia bacterium]
MPTGNERGSIMQEQIGRRAFVKGAALGTAALAVAGLAAHQPVPALAAE